MVNEFGRRCGEKILYIWSGAKRTQFLLYGCYGVSKYLKSFSGITVTRYENFSVLCTLIRLQLVNIILQKNFGTPQMGNKI